MAKTTEFTVPKTQFTDSISAILKKYNDDPETAHANEDALLELYIRMRASKYKDSIAQEIVVRLLDVDRRRWWA